MNEWVSKCCGAPVVDKLTKFYALGPGRDGELRATGVCSICKRVADFIIKKTK